jgi:hypothetical protein
MRHVVPKIAQKSPMRQLVTAVALGLKYLVRMPTSYA